MVEKLKSHYLLFVLLIISSGLFYLYLNIQPQLTHSFSDLFDANKYEKIYRYFEENQSSLDVAFPFFSRILVPWLASLLPGESATKSFIIINFIFTLLSVASIYFLWIKTGISRGYIMTGFFWLLVHWAGIVRLNIFDPITVDVPIYFFQALLLLVLFKRKYGWLLLLAPVATLQKESFIGLLAVILIVHLYWIYSRKESFLPSLVILIALLLGILTKEAVNHYLYPDPEGRSSLITILFHARETLLNPFRFIRWLAGVFTAYGPLLILAVWYSIKNKKYLSDNLELLALSVTYLGFSFLGGDDFTRIAFLGFPFIMTWIFKNLQNVHGFLFKAAFIMGLPLMRLLSKIPDPAISGWIKFRNWYPELANPIIVILWLSYGVLSWFVFKTIEKKLAKLP